MANYDSIDLNWSWDGDYAIDERGDIQDTSSDFLLSLVNEIQTFVKSESFDWEKDLMVGSNLPDFLGFPNTEDTGSAIEERIKNAIVNQGLVQAGDLQVRVLPVAANQVLIMITVRAQPTPRNGLVPGQPLKISLVYDTMEGGVFFLKNQK